MMNPVPWLQMTNMISYQGLVRTFPKSDSRSTDRSIWRSDYSYFLVSSDHCNQSGRNLLRSKKKNGYVSDGFQEKHGPRFSPLCHSGGKHQRDR
ncbi:hypothetical protein, partial [Escherichia coli]